ncbi:MAG: alpha-L-fucosidase [Bacteroidaceae bacterium]|nr:alpha-L-fucosidase [Bacteroidaceae bacterium]
MKKLFTLLLVALLCMGTSAQVTPEAYHQWHQNKFSMFIHFGLYSAYGGVYNGKPVTSGYSEQIQSFAGIFSDWYAETALKFDPVKFNADEIVALAKEAGMRSIVITTKHHDGFCMFKTATTEYNSVDATPSKRDYVKELSDACRRGGINFAIYFSLIDWNFPHAYPISSHNCDFITPQHHEFTKTQVTELLTNYGPVSELWFDMGSNRPEQSKELYELVHKLQPNCMVSGRLGNGWYDFAVMADNTYPEGALQAPWQSAASMFNETWSYRSWQKRGDAHAKAMEKLRSLINVVSHGGNFLLNIGPRGDGSVVEFESEVLKEIGAWLKTNGEAIYGTEASPFREDYTWGKSTRKGNKLYLILSGEYPTNGTIELNLPGYKLQESKGMLTTANMKGNKLTVILPEEAYNDQTVQVVELTFDREVLPQVNTAADRTSNYSYDCFDYYSNYRSTVSYEWALPKKKQVKLELTYTPEELGKEIALTTSTNGKAQLVKLEGGKEIALKVDPKTQWGKRYICGPRFSLFDRASTIQVNLEKTPYRRGGQWKEINKEKMTLPVNIIEDYYIMQMVESPKAQDVLLDVAAGNAIELFVNGVSVMKHSNPYRCKYREEKVLVHLNKGSNQIILRAYNRFEKETTFLLRPSDEQVIYKQQVVLNVPAEDLKQSNLRVKVRRTGLATQHADTELHNLRVK